LASNAKTLRGISKKIKGDIFFKKKLAEFLADLEVDLGTTDVKSMLLNGNRGYLAMNEKDLCDIFDRQVEKLRNGQLSPLRFKGVHPGWSDKGDKAAKQYLEYAESLYDLIFEKVILLDSL